MGGFFKFGFILTKILGPSCSIVGNRYPPDKLYPVDNSS